ncbi:TraB/GumN family protein [Pseudosulfitobacter koreensis]|uniref:TraB/GumN family protein n=1 Tax=Pseudosulfitobacter koreensis TaxID=2968472 RepID=A0ABT1YZ66_9RHOB|nr:TraB/GumN family protein [Pseudosulfitobacter koreense]MCR8826146.1 TraB/GumN family protein [Pseudosulfitobacter koreense]
MLRTLAFSLALLLPQMAFAACNGTDLRATLSARQSAELATELQDMPYPDGNHWVAHKGAQTIHLIGTLHLSDPRLTPIAARLAPVIASADLLLAEATEAEEAQLNEAMATRPELISLTSGPTLIELMPPEDWAELADAASKRGIPPFMAAKFQPWYLAMVLAMPPCVLATMQDGQHGLDKALLQIATENDVPAEALEPFDTLFTLMGQDTLEHQVALLRLGVIPAPQAEEMTATLVAQYFDEAHGAIMPLNRVVTQDLVDMPKAEFDAVFDNMVDTLLNQRNANWLPRITAAQGVTVVAVGAGHLGGTDGLLNMLADEGYALRRQPF